ncbi:UPF0175 family protein [Nibrella saemangeumensis]
MGEVKDKVELAVLLYQKGKLSMGQAARLAGMDRICFQFLLGSRQIPVNYDEAAFEEDLKTLDQINATRITESSSEVAEQGGSELTELQRLLLNAPPMTEEELKEIRAKRDALNKRVR